MAIAEHAIVSGSYSTKGITANTNIRDVSSMLDLWAHKETPFLNKLTWGKESGGLSYEWISEHLGFGYVQCSGAIGSAGTSFVITTSGTGLAVTEVAKQVQAGTAMYVDAASANAILVCTTIAASGTVTFSALVAPAGGVSAGDKLYIFGHFANEGSEPFPDVSRKRDILSNQFSIFREDVKITDSQANTDMYAVTNDPQHQISMRLLEMQAKRERALLLSYTQSRTSTVASYMHGAYGFMAASTAQDWVDATTTTMTEATFNSMVAECWDNGGTPNVVVANVKQIRLFTSWDSSRVRTTPDAKLGGHWVTKYLTDTGVEVEFIPIRKFPVNLAFVLDTDKIKLIPKKGQKLNLEKLARIGAYNRWQIISEMTMKMEGYNKGHHGMFTALT